MAGVMRRISAAIGLILLALFTIASGAWGALALLYSSPLSETARIVLAAIFGIVASVAAIALAVRRWRWRAAGAYWVAFFALLAWFFSLAPSNDRDWQADVATLPYATVAGDIVTMHNIRNFDYRSETDYTPAYYDKRFDVSKLTGVDIIAVYWMGPAVAHIFVSFEFAGSDHLAVSIETRKEKGEEYSTLRGFFRQYELYYVVADERDVIRLRTNYRKDPPEDVYVYRAQGPLENGRRLFLDYVRKINSLKEKAEFYNTLTTNCTTNIWMHTLVNVGHLPFSWKILASGYVPQYMYEAGRLDNSVPFAELQKRALVNPRAHGADKAQDFSRRIRE
ncbi:MAG TPA: DUF4105 domain-containing protein [Burkholderiales bacterium]|nr:DUF4105 domain-containing protein [Burkholderiales bacterium]